MLQVFGKPSHDNDGNKISYKASLNHLGTFGCYASRLIPKPQCHGEFSRRRKPRMMVGYMHDSTTLWRIWDRAFQALRSQSDVIFNEERNAHASCLYGNETNIFELPEEMEYVMEIGTGGDQLLYDHAESSRTGEGHNSGDHDCM
jgi:hypothetical protein